MMRFLGEACGETFGKATLAGATGLFAPALTLSDRVEQRQQPQQQRSSTGRRTNPLISPLAQFPVMRPLLFASMFVPSQPLGGYER